jgi:hypothetical protein
MFNFIIVPDKYHHDQMATYLKFASLKDVECLYSSHKALCYYFIFGLICCSMCLSIDWFQRNEQVCSFFCNGTYGSPKASTICTHSNSFEHYWPWNLWTVKNNTMFYHHVVPFPPHNTLNVSVFRLHIASWGGHYLDILGNTWNKRILFNMLQNNGIFLAYLKYVLKMNYWHLVYI